MTTTSLETKVHDFLAQKRIAVAGVSRNNSHHPVGNLILGPAAGKEHGLLDGVHELVVLERGTPSLHGGGEQDGSDGDLNDRFHGAPRRRVRGAGRPVWTRPIQ